MMDQETKDALKKQDDKINILQGFWRGIRLPTSWFFELEVILKNARWFATSRFSAYASGTLYALTATAALLNFGTTDPDITITSPGTYMLFARVRLDYNAATFASVRTVTIKIRRTNNTAADIVSAGFKTQIITTLTYTAGIICLPVTIYETNNTDDNLQVWGSVSVVPSAGSLDAAEAEIVAVRVV